MFEPIFLQRHEAHIYILAFSQASPTWVEQWFWILDEDERRRFAAFRFAKDREIFGLSHILVRRILSQYAPIPPEQWQFNKNAYGRPEIANNMLVHEGLQFNLSHTDGLAVCAVTCKMEIGIDIEKHRRIDDLEVLTRSVFTESEATDILSMQETAIREQRFYEYWTLKEAYIKGRGTGLSLPLQKFSFQRQAGSRRFHFQCDPALKENTAAWRFVLFHVGQGKYTMAASVRVSTDTDLAFVIKTLGSREIMPMIDVCYQGEVYQQRPSPISYEHYYLDANNASGVSCTPTTSPSGKRE